jgi:hypothetical protein
VDVAVLKGMLSIIGLLGIVIILWLHTTFGCGRITSDHGGGLLTREDQWKIGEQHDNSKKKRMQ